MSVPNDPPSPGLRKRWARFAARTRVAASLLLCLTAGWLADPTPEWLARGIPLTLAGLGLRAWAAGHLRKNERLAVSGPYGHVRNPLYIGSLAAALGLGICSGHPGLPVAVAAVFLLWFLPVVGEEESHLRNILPGYRDYESRVRRFWPSLRPRIGTRTSFDPALYVANREYSALLAFAAFVAFLWLKMDAG